MLRRLTIQNYALIDSLDIELPGGLIIITGETGAGKSIMLGALSLLLGGKGDVSALKDSSRNCVVEGEFELDGQELILRRVISPAGRTRNFINDEPANLGELVNIASRIIDIHAQHQHLLLTDTAYQMQVVDYFAGTRELLDRYRNVFGQLQKSEAALEELDAQIARSEGEREYKQFQFDKLFEASLKEGEMEELEQEQKQLANAEQIRDGICGAVSLMQPMGNSIVQNLKDAVHLLQKSSNFVPELQELCNRLESCRIECKDIEDELETLAGRITVSPQRLEQVEERLSLLYSLMRKHSAGSVEELLQIRDTLEQELLGADRSIESRDELIAAIGKLKLERDSLAQELSDARKAKVGELGVTLQNSIRDLQMPYAVFEVALEDSGKYTLQGKDAVSFLFSANGNEKLNPVQKAASGGELSRIMLCLKALMARFTGMPTMIFDEIDTGVSGSIADKMGELIGKMGERMQIIAITHLPQIASKRGTHLLVEKEFDRQNNAATRIHRIEGDERVKEVARMLSGSELTNAALENARELLKENDNK
ncbi:MAG: DNA repair protein RecN [Bacteroidales bacterium]|nr:DNA repair protein RecN [Bacteroidales bacterium]